ncbi:MAG: sugar-binding domain-containing protein [Bacteroidota bacterium]
MNILRYLTLFIGLVLCISNNAKAQSGIPREEHPKPQFMRERWVNLNGSWDFAIDHGNSGEEQAWHTQTELFTQKITVPFPPESKLSGIENKEFMPTVWYHRSFEIPNSWDQERVFLHFGAVDYDCQVWVNDIHVGRHYGGSVSFEFEITNALKSGENKLVVLAKDDIRSRVQPAGKQSVTFYNSGCCKYTRVTGIWQTVWLEARPQSFLKRARIIPDLDNSQFTIQPVIQNGNTQQTVKALILDSSGNTVQSLEARAHNGAILVLPIENPQPWSPQDPHLYSIELQLLEKGQVMDRVMSYAGLRKFHIEGNKIFLNNKPIFLRMVLDQGFYPDGIWTAPSDEALKNDIELAMSVGFNSARLHEKVFEERFHYWADKLGYITWGEYPDWGVSRTYKHPEAWLNVLREWREVVMRDRNHPSIVAWTPMNETHSPKQGLEAYRRSAQEIYDLTLDLDPTRPVNTSSGFLHMVTDIWSVHDYSQSGETLKERYDSLTAESKDIYTLSWDWYNHGKVLEGYDIPYLGQPFIMDEYGGTFWLPAYATMEPRGNGRNGWGFGKSATEVENLIEELTQALLANPQITGFTYTQLTDVEQEVNGVFTFDRKEKFSTERLKHIFGAPSAYEANNK